MYHKNDGDDGNGCESSFEASVKDDVLKEKSSINCYTAASAAATAAGCNDPNTTDLVYVQGVPMLVTVGSDSESQERSVVDVACGSRHTVVHTRSGGAKDELWGFGWNKYGQLGLGHLLPKDSPTRIEVPKAVATGAARIKMLRCGDWGTVVVTERKKAK